LQRRYPQGIYQSVYESGFCGFSVHHALISLGINNIIVNAADVPGTQKEKLNKNDPVDGHTHWTARFIRWLEEEVVLLSGSDKEPLLQHLAVYKQLRVRLSDITRKLRTFCKDEPYASDVALMCSVPGIAFISAIQGK
jgi:hypothetical protein